MTSAPLATALPQATPAQTDALLFAAYTAWRDNGHQILDALAAVQRGHVNAAVSALADEAQRWLLDDGNAMRRQLLWQAFESEFAARAKDER